jgi:hypothetical protein
MAITISGSGITSANIADGTITNGDIHPSAAIDGSKLTGLATPLVAGTDYLAPTGDGSALTGVGDGYTLIGKYLTSTTVSLSAGTYLLVPAGGGGGSSYNGTATNGGTSTIVLDGFTSYGKGGAKGTSNHHTGGSAGGRGGKGHVSSETGTFYGKTRVTISDKGGQGCDGNYGAKGGWSPTSEFVTITSTKTATVTVGAGGALGGSGTYASAGESGFCCIWKVG